MKYSIIGSGDIGTALARVFTRKKIEVGIANSRGPATLELGTNPRCDGHQPPLLSSVSTSLSLPSGTYELSVSAADHKYTQQGIIITPARPLHGIDVVLAIP